MKQNRWRVGGMMLILLASLLLGALVVSALPSLDDDFCFTRDETPATWTSYSSSFSIWPPGKVCNYRLEDGSRLVLPPPSDRFAPWFLGTFTLLFVYGAAYLTVGRSRAT
jgi:hypothetical protein